MVGRAHEQGARHRRERGVHRRSAQCLEACVAPFSPPLVVRRSLGGFGVGGRPGIVPGIITAGLVCTAFQFAYNELEVARIKYVSKKLQPPQSPAPSIPAPSLPEPVQPLPLQEDEPRPSLSERVFTALGWHKVSDEQYLEKLKLKREMYLHRIAELQKEKEEEARRTESHEKS